MTTYLATNFLTNTFLTTTFLTTTFLTTTFLTITFLRLLVTNDYLLLLITSYSDFENHLIYIDLKTHSYISIPCISS